LSLASPSCFTPSSTPATAGGIGIFCSAILRLRPSWRPSLLVPQTMAPSGAPSLARPVSATPVRAIVPEVFPGVANPGMSHPSAPDCIDFGIDPPLRLPRRVAVFVLGGFPFAPPFSPCLLERPRLPVRLLTLGNLDSSTSTTTTLRTASPTTTIHHPVRLHRHRHKGLPSA
jgi:hypothetical protein